MLQVPGAMIHQLPCAGIGGRSLLHDELKTMISAGDDQLNLALSHDYSLLYGSC